MKKDELLERLRIIIHKLKDLKVMDNDISIDSALIILTIEKIEEEIALMIDNFMANKLDDKYKKKNQKGFIERKFKNEIH